MRYSIFAIAILRCNCSPDLTPESSDPTKNILVQVECRSSQHAETSVVHALQFARYNDLEKQNDGVLPVIKAR